MAVLLVSTASLGGAVLITFGTGPCLPGLRSTAFSTHKSEDAPLPVTLLEALPRRLLLMLALHVLLLATSVAAVSVLDKKVQCEFRRAGLRADHIAKILPKR